MSVLLAFLYMVSLYIKNPSPHVLCPSVALLRFSLFSNTSVSKKFASGVGCLFCSPGLLGMRVLNKWPKNSKRQTMFSVLPKYLLYTPYLCPDFRKNGYLKTMPVEYGRPCFFCSAYSLPLHTTAILTLI